MRFIAYIKDELLIVLGTSSSETVLPQMIQKMEHLGASRSVVGLVIPTGYSFNLDGTNIYMTLATLFLAQATNTDLTIWQELGILGIAMITSKGASGVTGAGFITLAATLSIVPDIPIQSIAILVGIDKFMSECRALTNLIGNGVACVVISLLGRRTRQGEAARDHGASDRDSAKRSSRAGAGESSSFRHAGSPQRLGIGSRHRFKRKRYALEKSRNRKLRLDLQQFLRDLRRTVVLADLHQGNRQDAQRHGEAAVLHQRLFRPGDRLGIVLLDGGNDCHRARHEPAERVARVQPRCALDHGASRGLVAAHRLDPAGERQRLAEFGLMSSERLNSSTAGSRSSAMFQIANAAIHSTCASFGASSTARQARLTASQR